MRWTSRSEIFVWLDNIDSPGNVLTLGVNDVVERIYFYWRSCRCVCSVLSLDLASHPKDLYNLSPRILIGPTHLLKKISLHFKSALTYKHSERTMYLVYIFLIWHGLKWATYYLIQGFFFFCGFFKVLISTNDMFVRT